MGTIDRSRRTVLGMGAGIGILLLAPGRRAAAGMRVEVYKTRGCGCCSAWSEHLRAAGFAVTVREPDDLDAVRRAAGVPDDLAGCHTALVAGFTIEGHVPAAAVHRLLAARPAIRGLAVAGMPAGSPGMPSRDPDRYDVIAFTDDGRREVFMSFVGERAV